MESSTKINEKRMNQPEDELESSEQIIYEMLCWFALFNRSALQIEHMEMNGSGACECLNRIEICSIFHFRRAAH